MAFRNCSGRALCFFSTALLVCLCCIPGRTAAQSGTGEIRGRIILSAPDEITDELLRGRMLNRYETHPHTMGDSVQPYRLSEKAAVYIESVPTSTVAYDPPAEHPKMNQSQLLFRPLVLPVLRGTTVDFPNNDNLFHNVFSYSQPKEFDLGRYPKGQRKSVRFDNPGIVKVYCDIHSYMYATILVLENPYFTVPDDDGSYVIKNVPPGTYKVGFWYGRKKAASKTVVVTEGKAAVANFEN